MPCRLIHFGDALSQLLNVLLFNGHPNESLSGRAYRTQSIWRILIDSLLWFDTDHCRVAYYNDLEYCRNLIEQNRGR